MGTEMISNTRQSYHINTGSKAFSLTSLIKYLSKHSRRTQDAFIIFIDMYVRYGNVCFSQAWLASNVGWSNRKTAGRALARLQRDGLLYIVSRGFHPFLPCRSKTNLHELPEWLSLEVCKEYLSHLKQIRRSFSKCLTLGLKFPLELLRSARVIQQKVPHILKTLLFIKIYNKSRPSSSQRIAPSEKEMLTKKDIVEKVTNRKQEDVGAEEKMTNWNNTFSEYAIRATQKVLEKEDEFVYSEKDREIEKRFVEAFEERASQVKDFRKNLKLIESLPDKDEREALFRDLTKQKIVADYKWMERVELMKKEDMDMYNLISVRV
jgi:hypothetical protein